MKSLEINEKSQKKEGDILTKFLISHLLITQKLIIKVMPRYDTFILWVDMKRLYFV